MADHKLDAAYWDERYREAHTPWDIGAASPPLTAFLQQLQERSQRILIPGAGYAHEAHWLWQQGFRQITVLDISPTALAAAAQKWPNIPGHIFQQDDFFAHRGSYDLIVEQTFFCALAPTLRARYAAQMKALLRPGGHLVGLLFDFPLHAEGPPFGGNQQEYRRYFTPHFRIHKLERCYNSIAPRRGSELFVHLIA